MNPIELFKQGQDALRAAGFDPGPSDGLPGPKTLAATLAWKKANEGGVVTQTQTHTAGGLVDARSEGIIATLDPHVQQPFRDLLNAINAQTVPQFGLTGKYISGYRDEAAQNREVELGFSHAPWPHSAHNGGGGKVGYACDLGWFDAHGNYVENEVATALAVKIDRAMGFHSGADFGDPDHHCKRPPSMDAMTETGFINEMIRRHENGIPIWP